MGLTSEQVHWIAGATVALIAFAVLLHESGVIGRPWPRYLLPGGLLLWGVEAIVDPLLHGSATPGNYWAEAAQHALMGGLMLVMGGVELARVREWVTRRAAGLVLPVGLLVIAGLFLLHAQHDAAAPMLVLVAQHRAVGLTIALAATMRGLSELRHEAADAFRLASVVLILLVGLLFLGYTEGGSAPTRSAVNHGGH
jgi:hypothetical protein